MANREQLKILKEGADTWNKWRLKNPDIEVDLSKADLSELYLDEFNLSHAKIAEADLYGASLCGSNLEVANLSNAKLEEANLNQANLRGANLEKAFLLGAYLRDANLSETDLSEANLNFADLRGANLNKADLRDADLSEAYLSMTDFTKAWIDSTILDGNDLSETIGLDDVEYEFPCTLGSETFRASKGQIPEAFLKGCGLSDWEIEEAKLYDPGLSNEEIDEILYKIHDLRANVPIQISRLFISYSHSDSAFVNKLEDSLNKKSIRFWRDVRHATAGRLEKQINRAIRHNPTVLLILSEHSIKSDWVEHEVRTARELEKQIGRDVLCPIALDQSWKKSPWPKRVMEQITDYYILDFSAWNDDNLFESLFQKLIDGLELFYKE